MANLMGIARQQQVFAVEEDVKGELKFPEVGDLIVAAGFFTMNQQPSMTDSPEIVDSRDLIEQFQDKTPPGSWSGPIIARPSGSRGTPPNAAVLYKSLLGMETVNGGTSVVYSPAIIKPSFSLWLKKGHTIYFGRGATVGNAGVKTVTTGGVTFDMSGQFMELGWAGTDALAAGALTAATTITVINAKKYTIGARIQVGSDDNGGAGFEVTGRNTTSNVLTLGSGLTADASIDDVVAGFLPTGSQTSTALENRKSVASIDGTNRPIKAMDITVADDPQYLDDEITESGYAEEYVETNRSISGSLDIYFRQDDLELFDDGKEGNEKPVSMVCGNVTGVIMTIAMPRVKLAVPAVQETDPTVALNMPITALGTNGEDSISITFT